MQKKKEDSNSIQKGHQRIQEKIKEIRQNFSKAVTAGTRSGSGRIVYEFYDELIAIWGGSVASEPFPFGVSSHIFTDNNESLFNEAGKSSTKS